MFSQLAMSIAGEIREELTNNKDNKDGKEKNTTEAVEVTDEMFMNNFMKPIIELRFQ
jgi:hypothetical protein